MKNSSNNTTPPAPDAPKQASERATVNRRGFLGAGLGLTATSLLAPSLAFGQNRDAKGAQLDGTPGQASQPAPLILQEQGSFAAGGTMRTQPGSFDPFNPTDPAGQTFRGDHLYAFYQIPADARALPIVMWHGFGQFSKTWESTPDGREGFQSLFLRRGFSTYLIDQPRRGNAGKGMVGTTIKPTANEQFWFGQFRVGVWPDYFDGVQFSRDPDTLDQYFRQMTPDTGPIDFDVNTDAVSALFDRIGSGILFTHSHSGGMGWQAAMKSEHIKAIISFEPGSNFVFPEGEVPPPKPSSYDTLEGVPVPMSAFMALTRIPILIFYGDNIPAEPSDVPTQDAWRIRLDMAREWADAINRHGGDATVIHLPEIGITGNTHFAFSDLNNVQIADQVSAFLAQKGLD